jgi:ANTAR domain
MSDGAGNGSWTLLTGHGHMLVEIARTPDARIRDISPVVGLTERTVQAIVAGEAAGSTRESLPGRASPLARSQVPAASRPSRSMSDRSPGEHDHEAVVIVSHPGAAQPVTELAGLLDSATAQAAAACARSLELQQWATHVLTDARAARTDARAARLTSADARRQRRSSASGQELMQRSEHARLLARLESMPVIEQAKGIIMAQSHCGHAQAFDLLRRARSAPGRDGAGGHRLITWRSGC